MSIRKMALYGMICISAVLLIYLIYKILYENKQSFLHCARNPKAAPIIFVVSPGQSLKTISDELEQNNLVKSSIWFQLYARYKSLGRQIKAGEYEISAALTPIQILDILVKGKERLISISFPEGFNIDQIALRIQEHGFCEAKKFSMLCRDPDFIKKLKVPSHSLEGFLFPDTYFFPVHAQCKMIIKKMVATFFNNIPDTWRARANYMGFSLQEIITLASVIEKETGTNEERPVIASVFHNRLRKKMRLESDPTVMYGVSDITDRIRKKHLKRLTPYNTYQIKGLPKGPIANPGLLAIKAALYPAETNYLYFVSKNDKTHHFSKNLKEHNRAVHIYQIKGKVGGNLE